MARMICEFSRFTVTETVICQVLDQVTSLRLTRIDINNLFANRRPLGEIGEV